MAKIIKDKSELHDIFNPNQKFKPGQQILASYDEGDTWEPAIYIAETYYQDITSDEDDVLEHVIVWLDTTDFEPCYIRGDENIKPYEE